LKEKEEGTENAGCLSPGSNRGPLVCETSVITDYTTQTSCELFPLLRYLYSAYSG